jgi:hypothetical protein
MVNFLTPLTPKSAHYTQLKVDVTALFGGKDAVKLARRDFAVQISSPSDPVEERSEE